MSNAKILKAKIMENSAIQIVGQLYGLNNVAIIQAAITSIACEVRDVCDPGTVVSSPIVDKLTDIFDTFQLDALWTRLAPTDTIGYNFRHLLPAGTFPKGDRHYIVDYLFTPTQAGEAFRAQAEIKTLNAFSV